MTNNLHFGLAILLGLAFYPFFANYLPNQRQNSSAVIGVILLGIIMWGHGEAPNFEHGAPFNAALHLTSFLFFACAYLGRKRGIVVAERSPILYLSIGCIAAIIDALAMSGVVSIVLAFVQVTCFIAIAKTYSHVPKIILMKASFFAILYCLVNYLIHVSESSTPLLTVPPTVLSGLFYLLLGTSVAHMILEDFSRIRTRKGRDTRTRIDQDLMKLAFRGRRVLKDFRHDLRQPLSTMGILASVGKAISKDPEVTARYQHIQTAQKALKNMLEDFFDQLSNAIRYPENDNTIPLSQVSIDDVLGPLVEEYRLLADVKQLQIRYVSSEVKVLSNKEALTKIIRNGLDNAIKYTNQGGIVVGLRRRKGRVCVQIVDTGSGVESNKVAAHNKGWGHGAHIVADLSELILAKTECRNRYINSKLAGSVFEVVLPEAAEVSQRAKRPIFKKQNVLEAQVMAMNHNHLLDIQRLLPVQGFDKVKFSLNGPYKSFLTALHKGMSPVYILYAGEPTHKNRAMEELTTLGSLLDFAPCCILIYNASLERNPHVEFDRTMIRIPLIPGQTNSGLSVISELFPSREKEIMELARVTEAAQKTSELSGKSLLTI